MDFLKRSWPHLAHKILILLEETVDGLLGLLKHIQGFLLAKLVHILKQTLKRWPSNSSYFRIQKRNWNIQNKKNARLCLCMRFVLQLFYYLISLVWHLPSMLGREFQCPLHRCSPISTVPQRRWTTRCHTTRWTFLRVWSAGFYHLGRWYLDYQPQACLRLTCSIYIHGSVKV